MRALSGFVLLLLTACGGPAVPPEPRIVLQPVDACQLIPPREAEAAAGMQLDTVGAALDNKVHEKNAKCSFGITPDGQFRMVSLEVRQFTTLGEAKKQQQDAERSLPRLTMSDELSPVEGVGDRAVWTGGELSQLHVLAGHRRLIITMEIGEQAHRKEQASRMAQRALLRLEGKTPESSRPGQFQLMVDEPKPSAPGT